MKFSNSTHLLQQKQIRKKQKQVISGILSEIKYRRMGCDSSKLTSQDDNQQINKRDFKITYRQFISNSRGEIFNLYHFSDLIHRGPNSVIRKVRHRVSKIQRVCKIVGIQNMKQLRCMRQVEMLKYFDHPNVVKLQQYFIQKHCLYIIFEKIYGLSLQDSLFKQKQLSYKNVISIMSQLLSAVSMLHSQNITHRNIQPQHVLLEPKQGGYMLKLIDFSTSVFCDMPNLKPPTSYPLQKAYSSTESQTHPTKHDIFCCGLVFISLLGGKQYLKNIRRNPRQCIQKLMASNHNLLKLEPILVSLLQLTPQKRPLASQILQHQVFTKQSADQEGIKIVLGNLRKCNVKDKLKSTLWMFATVKLQTFYNKVELMNQFYHLDKNKDGKIQFQQLCQGLADTFGLTKQEAQRETKNIFNIVDKNDNGDLDFSQFVMGAYLVGKNLSEAQLRILFNQIDHNKDGVITQDQLNQTIEGLQQFQLLANLRNKLDFQNFKKIMKSYIARISQKH